MGRPGLETGDNMEDCVIGKQGKKPAVGLRALRREMARRSPGGLARLLLPDFELSRFHGAYYGLLGAMAMGKIRRMMVSVPPQHGKSLGAAVVLPAFLLGRDPSLRLAVASYSFGLARGFGQQVQRLMEEPEYGAVFPNTWLKGRGTVAQRGERTACRTAQGFDCVGERGGLRLVGRGGSLTGNRVDVLVVDDMFKDAMEANSPLVRDRVWEWYNAVARTRLHDGSQELVVGTRWHEDDLIGRLCRTEGVVELAEWDGVTPLGPEVWLRVNFEALMGSPASRLDERTLGEALWPERLSEEGLLRRRRADGVLFEALYQGNPSSREGLLYGEFGTYTVLPAGPLRRANYTDTADTGRDRLCSICYAVGVDGVCYVTEVLFSAEPMEVTEGAVAALLGRNGSRVALFESNNGGRGFARAVQRLMAANGEGAGHVAGCCTGGAAAGGCVVRMFHQRENKEARILTNATLVTERIRMPEDWRLRWPEFAAEVCSFRRVFRTNAHDDGPDALTGIVETEMEVPTGGRICHVGFGR